MSDKLRIQLTDIDATGKEVELLPINTSKEVIVGIIPETEDTNLPGESSTEKLSESLTKIKNNLVDMKEKVKNSGVEITMAEYNKLSYSEKMNGTVYYITDAGFTIASVIDDLETDSSTEALSAKQGKVLKEMIDEKMQTIAKVIYDETTETLTIPANYLSYNAETETLSISFT